MRWMLGISGVDNVRPFWVDGYPTAPATAHLPSLFGTHRVSSNNNGRGSDGGSRKRTPKKMTI